MKRLWIAKPFLVAYIVVVGFTVGLLVNRHPSDAEAIAALARGGGELDGQAHEQPTKEPPIWLQLFRPSQPTARLMLRIGLPMLTVADGSAQKRSLLVYWTGQAGGKPQSLFQSVLPFLRSSQASATGNNAGSPGQLEKGRSNGASQSPLTTEGSKTDGQKPQTKPAVVSGGIPLIGIYHTHDWESFLSEFPALKLQGPEDMIKLNSEDHSKRTVVGLGDLLASRLKDQGITTVHADWSHRLLGYDYAYTASRKTAKEILTEHPSVKILVDIHRDAVWDMHTAIDAGGQKAARIRCVMGTEDQPHPDENKGFCQQLMNRLESKHPGITFPTVVKPYNFNQDLTPGSILLEIGNALDGYQEAERSIGFLAEALAELVREGTYPR